MISVKLFERAAKRQKIHEQQRQYNEEMVKQTRQLRKAPFKMDDMVAIKIDRVDKTSPKGGSRGGALGAREPLSVTKKKTF